MPPAYLNFRAFATDVQSSGAASEAQATGNYISGVGNAVGKAAAVVNLAAAGAEGLSALGVMGADGAASAAAGPVICGTASSDD